MGFLPDDIPELRGYKTGVVLSNMALLQRRHISLGEVTLAQLYELARAVYLDAAGDPDTIDSILLSLLNEEERDMTTDREADTPLSGTLDINRDMLVCMYEPMGLYQRLAVYRFLVDMLPKERAGGYRTHSDTLTSEAVGRVAYMEGDLSDKAYLAFAGKVPNCRVARCHSFVDACEEVYNQLCEYCILPLESTDQGRLTAFSRLVVKYGLFIVAAFDAISHTNGESRATRFGLLCRNAEEPADMQAREGTTRRACPFPPPILPAGEDIPCYVEILHATSSAPSLADLLAAAAFCGMRLRRADGLSVQDARIGVARQGAARQEDPFWDGIHTHKGQIPLCLILDTRPDLLPDREERQGTGLADIRTFLYWLALEAPEDRMIGLYSLL